MEALGASSGRPTRPGRESATSGRHGSAGQPGSADESGAEAPAGFVGCDETIERLYSYLDGELTEERRVEISRHLDLCGPCVGAYGFEAELRKVDRQPLQGPRARRADHAGGRRAARRAQPPEQLTARGRAVTAGRPTGRRRPGPYTGPRDRHPRADRPAEADTRSRRRRADPGAVAWDTAERVAGWVGSRSHLPAPYRPDLLQARLRGADRPGRGAGGRVHRAAFGVGAGPGPGHRPGRLGPRQRRRASSAWSAPTSTGSTRRGCRPPTGSPSGWPAPWPRPAGWPPAPRWAWCWAGSPPGCSASTTCSSPRRPSRTRTSCTSSGPTWWPSSSCTDSSPASSGCGWPSTR